MMSSPEDRAKRRRRIKNHIAKDLHTIKYRQRVREDKKRKVLSQDLSHSELVRLINKETEDGS